MSNLSTLTNLSDIWFTSETPKNSSSTHWLDYSSQSQLFPPSTPLHSPMQDYVLCMDPKDVSPLPELGGTPPNSPSVGSSVPAQRQETWSIAYGNPPPFVWSDYIDDPFVFESARPIEKIDSLVAVYTSTPTQQVSNNNHGH